MTIISVRGSYLWSFLRDGPWNIVAAETQDKALYFFVLSEPSSEKRRYCMSLVLPRKTRLIKPSILAWIKKCNRKSKQSTPITHRDVTVGRIFRHGKPIILSIHNEAGKEFTYDLGILRRTFVIYPKQVDSLIRQLATEQ